MRLQDMTIGQKIAGSFGAIAVLLVAIGLFNYYGIGSIVRHSEEVIQGNLLDAELAQREVDHLNWMGEMCRFLLDSSSNSLNVQTNPQKCGFGQWYYGEGRRHAEELVPSLAPILARIERPHRELHESAVAVQRAAQSGGGRVEANVVYNVKSVPALAAVQSLLHEVRQEARKQVITDKAMLSAARKTRLTVTLGAAFTVLFAILVAFLTHKGIAMILGKIARQMEDSSSQVADAAGQVSASSQNLAEGASEQAASLEETSASLEEVASMTRQDAENATQVDQVMKNASSVVHGAEDSMQRLIASMEEISGASAETQKIVKTIDEIAFQTNLLALNAAVEAARAGEAGAGFAVVADEVRNLAMRAAEAARNTSSLIEGTVQKVDTGSKLVGETSESFAEAARAIDKVSTLVAEIAGSTGEQSKAIAQVSTAISQIDTVTQQNAATAEESASASEELSAQAEMMSGAVKDLVRIIGGLNSRGGAARRVASSGAKSGSGLMRPPQKRTPAGSSSGGGSYRERAALPPTPPAKKESGKRSEAATAHSSQAVSAKKKKAEEVIPFDDEDFEDF